MALASRLLSRSTRQLCAGQVVLRPEHAVPIRSFAKEAAAPTTLKGDQVLKDIFYEVKNKLETAIGVLRKEKITIDPEDPAAVSEYAKVMKSVRQKANLLSESEIIKFNIEVETHEIPDARTYLLKLKEMRVKRGLIDSQGIEDLQMAALDKVEKELKKPLLRNNEKGIALLKAEFDKINQKLGIRKEEMPKYEEQLELKIAKAGKMKFNIVSPVGLSCLFFLFLTGTSAQNAGSIVTRELFEQMLSFRNNDACPAKGFYTYDAFIAAANSFPGFGTTGDDTARKKEIAAFFGQTSHETNGGSAGTFTGGYCFVKQIEQSDRYYGRGPIQLTHQSNYERAGQGIGVGQDLVNNPDLVATDPIISFKTAIWFWMTAQDNKPSCHNVIIGQWTPSPTDTAANRVPGYGVITNIINGQFDCGMGPNTAAESRIGFYRRYCGMLNVPTGENLDCNNQKNFAQG